MRRVHIVTALFGVACGGLAGPEAIPNPRNASDVHPILAVSTGGGQGVEDDGVTSYATFGLSDPVVVGGVPCAVTVDFHDDHWECRLDVSFEVRPGYAIRAMQSQSFHYGAAATPFDIEWSELEDDSAPPVVIDGYSCAPYIGFLADGSLDGCVVDTAFSKGGIDFPIGTMVIPLEGGATAVWVGPDGAQYEGRLLPEDQMVTVEADGSVDVR